MFWRRLMGIFFFLVFVVCWWKNWMFWAGLLNNDNNGMGLGMLLFISIFNIEFWRKTYLVYDVMGKGCACICFNNLSTIKGKIWCILVFLPRNYRVLLFLHLWLVLNHTLKNRPNTHTTNQLNFRLLQVLDSLGLNMQKTWQQLLYVIVNQLQFAL